MGVGRRSGFQAGGGGCKLGTPRCSKRVRELVRPSCTRRGIGLQAQEKAAVPQACRGVHRGRVCTQRESSPTAERAWGMCLTHLLKSKGIVPPSRWERCRPGGPQRRVGPSPLPTPPWLPRPRQPARHSPLASRRREVTLRAAHWALPPPPAAPSAAQLKGPKDRRDGAGWEWDAAQTQFSHTPDLVSFGLRSSFLVCVGPQGKSLCLSQWFLCL